LIKETHSQIARTHIAIDSWNTSIEGSSASWISFTTSIDINSKLLFFNKKSHINSYKFY